MKRLNAQLSNVEYEELKDTATQLERSMNDCIREAVREWLEKLRKK